MLQRRQTTETVDLATEVDLDNHAEIVRKTH